MDSSEGPSPLDVIFCYLPSSTILTFFFTAFVSDSLISGSITDDACSKVISRSYYYSCLFSSSHGLEAGLASPYFDLEAGGSLFYPSPLISSSELLLKRNRLDPPGYCNYPLDFTCISEPCPFSSCALENEASRCLSAKSVFLFSISSLHYSYYHN